MRIELEGCRAAVTTERNECTDRDYERRGEVEGVQREEGNHAYPLGSLNSSFQVLPGPGGVSDVHCLKCGISTLAH